MRKGREDPNTQGPFPCVCSFRVPTYTYRGMPSIAASDPAFPALGYWRGFIWAPHIQLVWWALDHPRYSNVSAVAQGRKALVKQSYAMELR